METLADLVRAVARDIGGQSAKDDTADNVEFDVRIPDSVIAKMTVSELDTLADDLRKVQRTHFTGKCANGTVNVFVNF